MRRMFVFTSIPALVALLVGPIQAQDSKSARGTVTAVAGDTITIKAGSQELKFNVDAKTEVVAEGAGTASRAAAAKGAGGPKLGEIVKSGDAVEVSYREAAGTLQATRIRRVPSPGAGGGSTSDQRAAEKTETATGKVTAVSNTSLTITGSTGGGGTFTQSYTIDTNTRVVGEGAGTASAKGKVTLTDLVKNGSQVTVTYRAAGSTLTATEVRVR